MLLRLQAAAATRTIFFGITDKPRQLLGPCQMRRIAAGTSRKQLFLTTHTCGRQGTRVPRRLGADRPTWRDAVALQARVNPLTQEKKSSLK